MRGFVASWFFPPQTSAEGLVTFKLLKYSGNEYDVCCSTSDLWGYEKKSHLESSNIHVYPVKTNDLNQWVKEAVDIFCQQNKKKSYDFIMTRSMPPESVQIGLKIKELFPDIKWIASFGDPISRNPYELYAYVFNASLISEQEKGELLSDLDHGSLDRWLNHKVPQIKLLANEEQLERKALRLADNYIFPTKAQQLYTLKEINSNRAWVIPHTYDPELIEKVTEHKKTNNTGDTVVLTFAGLTDSMRSLKPLVHAADLMRKSENPALDKLRFRIIGITPQDVKDMAYNFHLQDYFSFEDSIGYDESLQVFVQSDWLIHVEAILTQPAIKNGSIFFASKLADYFGCKKPILALGDNRSPALQMIKKSGGITANPNDIISLSRLLTKIANHDIKVQVNDDYVMQFSAKVVAEKLDKLLQKEISIEKHGSQRNEDSIVDASWRVWPNRNSQKEKLISICIPSYNVERYLDRCLLSMVRMKKAGYLDIIVVNDGSSDHTSQIGHIYQKRYPGIVHVIDKENGGHGSTINSALEHAVGKYFMVVDGDDWINSDDLDKVINEIQTKKIDVDLIQTNYCRVDMETGESTPCFQSGMEYNKVYSFEDITSKDFYIVLSSSMYKTSVLHECKLKLQEKTFYVDVEYIMLTVPYIQKLVYLDASVYRYCVGNTEQSVALPNMVKRYDHHDRVMHRVIDFYKTVPANDVHKEYMKTIINRLLFTHYAIALVYDEDKQRGLRRGKEFDDYLKKAAPDLYSICTNNATFVHAYRKTKFMKTDLNQKSGFKTLVSKTMQTPIGYKLFYNPLTKKLAHSSFIHIPIVTRAAIFLTNEKAKRKER